MTERSSTVLVFGENDNDRSALIELILAIRPDVSHLKFRKLRQPPVYLRKKELPATRRKSANEIARLVHATRVASDITFIVTHQDCDAIEPAHEVALELATKELKDVGIESAIIAVPAFELETWWMLFPGELKKVRPLWRAVDYGTQNVGLISEAKERLTADLRPDDPKQRSKCRDYQEADSVIIAKKIRETGAARRETKAESKSFNVFKTMIETIVL